MPALIDEIGNKYGRLTVVERARNSCQNKAAWLCHCECDNYIVVRGDHLRSGHTQSCGCFLPSHPGLIDETGNRYGLLTVIERAGNDKGGAACWRCCCNCSKEIVTQGGNLRQGHTQSCGCLTALPDSQAAYTYLYAQYRAGARRRKYEFKLSKTKFNTLSQQPCCYCGAEPSQTLARYNNFVFNGLDRKDCSLGYTIDNVVPCCGPCNYAKRSMNVEEFRDWIVRVYKHFVKGEWKCNG